MHLRGHLQLIELECNGELSLLQRWLPDPDSNSAMTLSEVDRAVGQSERHTCGSVLGVRAGSVELAIEAS